MEVVDESRPSAPPGDKGVMGDGVPGPLPPSAAAAASAAPQQLPLPTMPPPQMPSNPGPQPPAAAAPSTPAVVLMGHQAPLAPPMGVAPTYDYRLTPSALLSSTPLPGAASAGMTYTPMPVPQSSSTSSLSLAATLSMPLKRPRGRPPLLNKPPKTPKSASPRSVHSNDDDASASSAAPAVVSSSSASVTKRSLDAMHKASLIRPQVPIGAGTCGAEGDGDAMQQLKVRSLSTSVQSQKIVNYLLTGNPLSALDIMALLPHVVPDQILGILDVLEMLGVIYKVRSRQAAKRSAVESSKSRKAAAAAAAATASVSSSSSSCSVSTTEGDEAGGAMAPQGPAPPQYTLAAFARAPSHIADVRKIKDDIVDRRKNAENTMKRIVKLETFLAHLRSKNFTSREEKLKETRAFMAELRAQHKPPVVQPPVGPPAKATPPLHDGSDSASVTKQFSIETDSLYSFVQQALDGLDKAVAVGPTPVVVTGTVAAGVTATTATATAATTYPVSAPITNTPANFVSYPTPAAVAAAVAAAAAASTMSANATITPVVAVRQTTENDAAAVLAALSSSISTSSVPSEPVVRQETALNK